MKQRCYNSNGKDYHKYGKRDIQVCEEWKNNYLAFKEWAFINGYKEGLTLDRVNKNENYTPNNCQWLTLEEHGRKSRDEQTGRRLLSEYFEIY